MDFTDVEILSFRAICEEAGGEVLTYDFSEECPLEDGDDDTVGGSSLGTIVPFCVKSSCVVDEACSAVAESDLALLNDDYTTSVCATSVSNCDALKSAVSTILTPVVRTSIAAMLVRAIGIFN